MVKWLKSTDGFEKSCLVWSAKLQKQTTATTNDSNCGYFDEKFFLG